MERRAVMAQASNNQMYFLRQNGIEPPQPQKQKGVTWKVKEGWSRAIVETIITYLKEGNGAGPGETLEERRALYCMTRRLYEGRYVVEISGEEETRYLVLQIYPKTSKRVVWEAEEYGISRREVDPFWLDFVAEGEPADYEGHIQGGADICDYRLAESNQEAKAFRWPKRVLGDSAAFSLQTKRMLFLTIRAFTECEGFCDGDFLPLPEDVADYQRLLYRQLMRDHGLASDQYPPLSAEDVADVYRQSHYVQQEGNEYRIVARAKVVTV
jgi:hypothetical protein